MLTFGSLNFAGTAVPRWFVLSGADRSGQYCGNLLSSSWVPAKLLRQNAACGSPRAQWLQVGIVTNLQDRCHTWRLLTSLDCGAIEIQAVKTWNSSAFSNKFSYLFARCRRWRSVIIAASIKLPKCKNQQGFSVLLSRIFTQLGGKITHFMADDV